MTHQYLREGDVALLEAIAHGWGAGAKLMTEATPTPSASATLCSDTKPTAGVVRTLGLSVPFRPRYRFYDIDAPVV
jgi:hypothetical protein